MKKNLIVILTVIITILSVLFIYPTIINQKIEEKEEEIVEIIRDNAISPYTNQGVTIEIKRIRNRSLLDKMLKIGTS